MTDETGTRAQGPVIMVVDGDPAALDRTAGELGRRYARDYRIVSERSAASALAALQAMRENGDEVAVVLAARGTSGLTGVELLARVKGIYPDARRGLLIDFGAWGDAPTAEAIFRAMSMGHMDYYVLKPWRSPDELFHRTICEFLHEWSRTDPRAVREISVVADRWSARGHELRAVLTRNGVPHAFFAPGSPEGHHLLAQAGLQASDCPVVVTFDGRVLADPSNAEIARAYGVNTELAGERDFDVVVVGAGPAGLAVGVSASSEGLRTLVAEGEAIGGQAGSSSRIRNYLGFSRGVSGAELAQRAYQQAWVFGTHFLLMREVSALRKEGGRFAVTIAGAGEARARAVILATGVSYRRLAIPALEDLTGSGVFYGASAADAQGLAGQDVYVVGGGNSAGQAAMHLSRYARRVRILVRGESLAESMSAYLRDEIAAADRVGVQYQTEVTGGGGDGRLAWLRLRDNAAGTTATVNAAALFILIGARPHTSWLPQQIERDHWGFIMTGPDITTAAARLAQMYETGMPGVFAVGDARHGSVKRVASAVGEGSVVIQQVLHYLRRSAGRATGTRAMVPGGSADGN
jgi:thioredoxin reductase (NADPH)